MLQFAIKALDEDLDLQQQRWIHQAEIQYLMLQSIAYILRFSLNSLVLWKSFAS